IGVVPDHVARVRGRGFHVAEAVLAGGIAGDGAHGALAERTERSAARGLADDALAALVRYAVAIGIITGFTAIRRCRHHVAFAPHPGLANLLARRAISERPRRRTGAAVAGGARHQRAAGAAGTCIVVGVCLPVVAIL